MSRKRIRSKIKLGSLIIALAGWLLWQFSPLQPLVALANLTDPAKLATLGERGANARVNKAVYWLNESQARRLPAETAIDWIHSYQGLSHTHSDLVKATLLRNLKAADELGLFTGENPSRLRNGNSGVVTRGPYKNDTVEIDHIVPFSLAPEVGNELANLEMLPKTLNRKKSDQVGQRQLDYAKKLLDAGLLNAESLAKVQAKFNEANR